MTDETIEQVEPLGQEAEQEEIGQESSLASEEKHEEKQDGIQKRFNDLTAQKYAEQRRADELEAKLKALEAQKAPVQQAEQASLDEPELPDDIYDDEAMRAYHKQMAAYAKKVAALEAKAIYESSRKEQELTSKQTAQQQRMAEITDKFVRNSIKDGVTTDELRAAEVALNGAGISSELGEFIMSDPNGGKIAKYLHDNPADMHEILSMSPTSAAVKIATEIKARALSTTPKVSKAPEPVDSFSGGGARVKGSFEQQFPDATFI